MTKIVINKCYGGFGLSDEGMLKYAELKDIEVFPKTTRWYTVFYIDKYQHKVLSQYDISRDDKDLVKTVEELGLKANGDFAELKVVEIPDDVEWVIYEYDGMEHVAEKHRTWH